MTKAQPKPNQFALQIERIFDAPRERVWKAWVDKDMVLQWGGPRDYPLVKTEADMPFDPSRMAYGGFKAIVDL
ncbi:MAG: hypothetical protein CO093_08595 [Alphaproteobacteria bacterium CG_4_9_14_3_um_filter_47_13]|nr:MAG: hypothetical protein CO093_08595 [Alphaproteobacteria bacterium CG_4_9_14_3_um_filter_47_13]